MEKSFCWETGTKAPEEGGLGQEKDLVRVVRDRSSDEREILGEEIRRKMEREASPSLQKRTLGILRNKATGREEKTRRARDY